MESEKDIEVFSFRFSVFRSWPSRKLKTESLFYNLSAAMAAVLLLLLVGGDAAAVLYLRRARCV